MVVAIKYQEDSQTEYNETKDEEQQEEVLNVMTEIHSIIFLVPLLNHLTFISKHFIDLMNMFLHLTCHPFVFFVEHDMLKLNISQSVLFNLVIFGAILSRFS